MATMWTDLPNGGSVTKTLAQQVAEDKEVIEEARDVAETAQGLAKAAQAAAEVARVESEDARDEAFAASQIAIGNASTSPVKANAGDTQTLAAWMAEVQAARLGKLNVDGDGSAVTVTTPGTVIRLPLAALLSQVTNAIAFGALGNGEADDAPALQGAADALSAAGGGELFLPPGTYLLATSPSASTYGLFLPSNVILRGAGLGKTVIKVADGANIGVVAASDVIKVSIRDLTIDGSKATNPSGLHGIRFGGSCSDVDVADVMIKNTANYGIGLQNSAGNGGYFKRIRIDRVTIDSPGSDGFDVKNVANSNEDLQISNVTVLSPNGTGIDVRGPALLSNINVRLTIVNSTGIRFRGTDMSGNGTGGRYGSLVNFHVDCGNTPSTDGLVIDDPYVKVVNGHVSSALGAGVWITTAGKNVQILNVSVSNSRNGFLVEGEDSTLMNCFGLTNIADVISETTSTLGCSGVRGGTGAAISAGLANAPAYRSIGDPDTGMFFPTADAIALTIGGRQRVTWDTAGRELLGTLGVSVPTYNATDAQSQQVGTNGAGTTKSLQRYSANSSEAVLEFVKSRGIQGNHGSALNGDFLGSLRFVGSDGTSWLLGAYISAVIDGVPGLNDIPTRLFFATAPDGSATPVERMRIDNAGNLVMGTGALATSASSGFFYAPSSAGTPTGTPVTYAGRVPIQMDTANGRLCAYYGGAWHYTTLT